jgi:hypothetical protein
LARRIGIRLRLRQDFNELVYINRQQVARGTWFCLVDHLNPEYSDLTPENSYRISDDNEQGEIVLTQAGAFVTGATLTWKERPPRYSMQGTTWVGGA